MLKCNDYDRYYWQSRCFDGINDCDNGEDEQFDNPLCNPMTPFFRMCGTSVT